MFCYGITTLPLGVVVGAHKNTNGFVLPFPELPLAERLRANATICASMDAIATTLVDPLHRENLTLLRALAPGCKLIANCSVGYNHIDIAAARELGFTVTNTPHVLTEATADLALALMLIITRRLAEGRAVMQNDGRYPGWQPTYLLGVGLQNKTVGIVGCGEIGRAFASRARALQMNVVRLKSTWGGGGKTLNQGIDALDEDTFLANCDVISIHCKLTPESRNWLDERRLQKTKKGVYIVNTARGEVIDEAALREALDTEQVGGAGLDVFCNEPVLSEHLKGAPRVFVLPHLGSSTFETRTAMGECVMENIRAFALGLPVPNKV